MRDFIESLCCIFGLHRWETKRVGEAYDGLEPSWLLRQKCPHCGKWRTKEQFSKPKEKPDHE